MFIRKCRDGLCAPILLLFLLVGVAQANAENRAPDLAFVLDQTQRHHPMLARIEAERRRFDPAVALAGQASPLRLSLETENIGDRVSDRLETTLSLAGVLAWSGQPQARADLANTRNQATRLRLAQLRRDVLAEAASRFIRLAGAQAELQQAQRELSLARQTRDATRQRQRAGAASPADLKRASLRTSQAELRKGGNICGEFFGFGQRLAIGHHPVGQAE